MLSGLDKTQSKNFSLITIANFFLFCNFSSFFLLPLFIKKLGGNEANIGFIMGSFGVTSLGSIPLVAFLIDKYGRRWFMLIGAIVMFSSSLSYLFVRELSLIFYILRMLQGIGFAFFFTSAGTAVADFIPEMKRGQGLGIFGAFTIASYALGPTIGEGVIEKLGFSFFFIYTSSFSLIAILLVYPTKDAPFKRSVDPYGLDFFRLAFSRRYSVPLLSNLILAGGFGSVLNFISVYVRPKGLDVFYFFLIYAVTITSVRIIGGRVSDVFGRKRVASPSLFVFSLSIAAMIFINSVYKLVLISFLFSLSYGMLYPTLSALMMDKANPDERGKAMGAFNACFGIGTNFLAFVFGVIARDLGFTSMYLISAAFVFLGFLLFTLFEPQRDS
ncbi:MAG: transport protein, belonging to the Major Facilitator Superfamily, of which is a member [Candidatus Dadabacteria bacterium CSP1-2]|nr:MAG: transport protein, belonging to the Major Facilitator Superfamily, of which is a member [Candidatus Dadabacteria bacterium CSP1-2]